MLRKLSLAWLSVGETDPVTLISAAAAAGFGRVGLKVVPNAGSAVPPLAGNAPLIRDTRRALAAEGIEALEMGGVWFGPGLDPRQLVPSLEAGAELGARYVIAAAGDECRQRLVANIASLCALAAPFGVKVAIEFIAYSPIATLQDALDAAAATGHADCGVVVDALHLARSGTPLAALASAPPGSICLAHLCDAPRAAPADLRVESRTQRLLPGEGELALSDFIDAVPPGVAFEVEAPCAALASLDPIERALRVAAATRRFLEFRLQAGKEAPWNVG